MQHMTSTPDAGRRVLRFLSPGPASMRPAAIGTKLLIEAGERGVIAVAGDLIDLLASRGVVVRASHTVGLSDEGHALAKRLLAMRSAERQRDIDVVVLQGEPDAPAVLANLSESPLGQLARRRAKDGTPFLTPEEYRAGERLRVDYTRGQIMPRLGANWIASVSSGKRGGAGGMADLTDAALAARQRVEKAIAAVGPELSGVLIDVCCFLKGLELVESERGWPVRSAKIVLKTALAALGRHYCPPKQTSRPQTLHWGTPDYRPTID